MLYFGKYRPNDWSVGLSVTTNPSPRNPQQGARSHSSRPSPSVSLRGDTSCRVERERESSNRQGVRGVCSRERKRRERERDQRPPLSPSSGCGEKPGATARRRTTLTREGIPPAFLSLLFPRPPHPPLSSSPHTPPTRAGRTRELHRRCGGHAGSLSSDRQIGASRWRCNICMKMSYSASHAEERVIQVFGVQGPPIILINKSISALIATYRLDIMEEKNAPSQKGSEVNLTLGGIDLNNSGSVVVKADKKLLTVLFPDGRDGRAFTLKAETLEDMYEWKTALENALAQAPSATLAMGQTGIFRNDVMESIEASFEQWKDKKSIKSMIIGRPILLALEDVDGSPSFLEKALRFIERYGVKVEGILRQSADVEEVERRVQEYEQGKNEFSPDEDAHVICDCIKHVLRELPTSPVPASCCTALLEAFRSNRGARISAIHTVISEMLPEPNRRLLQRILMMMREVASHKSENRMTISAVAACMSPLLLRPLLAGDCELEDAFDMGGDGSIQLLQAAAAANHAQAIVIILLEEYEKIFLDVLQEDAFSSELYSGSEDCDDGGDEEEEEQEDEDGDEDEEEDGEDEDEDEDEGDEEETTDDEILENGDYHDAQNDIDHSTEDVLENESIGTESLDESRSDLCVDLYEKKALEYQDLGVVTPKSSKDIEASEKDTDTAPSTATQHDINEELSISPHSPLPQHGGTPKSFSPKCENSNSSASMTDSNENLEGVPRSVYPMQKSISNITSSGANNCQLQKSARKNLSLESIEFCIDDESEIQRLETVKSDLQVKIAKEVLLDCKFLLQGNAMLQSSLEKRKEALHERRLALEQDVKRLQEQLQKERDLRASLEAGLMNMKPGHLSLSSIMDHKMRADLEEIALAEADVSNLKEIVSDLHGQLDEQLRQYYGTLCESCGQQQYANLLSI
ncbi:hypothetical protein Taro_024903, partial [Colocasia esculenta]|nr:hypothetical protein [Colocasia esculenta]